MRYLTYLYFCIFSLLPVRVLADGGPEELGHHWQSRAYIGEIHFQLVLMAALTVFIIVAGMISKRRASR